MAEAGLQKISTFPSTNLDVGLPAMNCVSVRLIVLPLSPVKKTLRNPWFSGSTATSADMLPITAPKAARAHTRLWMGGWVHVGMYVCGCAGAWVRMHVRACGQACANAKTVEQIARLLDAVVDHLASQHHELENAQEVWIIEFESDSSLLGDRKQRAEQHTGSRARTAKAK